MAAAMTSKYLKCTDRVQICHHIKFVTTLLPFMLTVVEQTHLSYSYFQIINCCSEQNHFYHRATYKLLIIYGENRLFAHVAIILLLNVHEL